MAETTISKTVLTFTILHRSDEPIESIAEALSRADDGHGVGWETGSTTTPVPDDQVAAELRELGNDGEFFDIDLDRLDDDVDAVLTALRSDLDGGQPAGS